MTIFVLAAATGFLLGMLTWALRAQPQKDWEEYSAYQRAQGRV